MMARTKIGDEEPEEESEGVVSRSWWAISRPRENWEGGWGGVIGEGWAESIGEKVGGYEGSDMGFFFFLLE